LLRFRYYLLHSNIAALALKRVDFEYKAVNLLKSEQTSDEYMATNASGQVPSLRIDNVTLNDSIAIIEYLGMIS